MLGSTMIPKFCIDSSKDLEYSFIISKIILRTYGNYRYPKQNLDLCNNLRKDRYSVVSVTKNKLRLSNIISCTISACSRDKLVTSKNGTTYDEEMPATYSLM
nr:RecName: Full=Beta-D-galactosidase regulatory protein [Clostridium acetobutylicum]AAA23217.1 beta-D-galactosidase regulatory protein (cbgR) [Clostridium acetobutylicum]